MRQRSWLMNSSKTANVDMLFRKEQAIFWLYETSPLGHSKVNWLHTNRNTRRFFHLISRHNFDDAQSSTYQITFISSTFPRSLSGWIITHTANRPGVPPIGRLKLTVDHWKYLQYFGFVIVHFTRDFRSFRLHTSDCAVHSNRRDCGWNEHVTR